MVRDVEALLRFLAERTAMPFAWGPHANDCVSFAAGAIRAQTGRRLLPDRRWSTALGAARVLKEFGGIENAVSNRLAPIAPALARRGDVAGVPDPLLGIRLLIVEGATLAGPGERGLVRLPRRMMTRAWSIAELLDEAGA